MKQVNFSQLTHIQDGSSQNDCSQDGCSENNAPHNSAEFQKNTATRSHLKAQASKKHQSGSAMIIVIFVIVVMSLLGITLIQLMWSNKDSHIRSMLGTQAWFVAHSANEWGLTQLYPLDEIETNEEVQVRCTALEANFNTNSTTANEPMNRLLEDSNCRITSMTCNFPEANAAYLDYQYFTIESTAQCGDADTYLVERTQQVTSKGLE